LWFTAAYFSVSALWIVAAGVNQPPRIIYAPKKPCNKSGLPAEKSPSREPRFPELLLSGAQKNLAEGGAFEMTDGKFDGVRSKGGFDDKGGVDELPNFRRGPQTPQLRDTRQ
jgi:hypothetical protein